MSEFNNSWNYGYVLNQDGLILIGASSSNPQASFLTSSGNTLSYSFGPGKINIEVNFGNSFFNPLQVGNGGTGLTLLTLYGVLIGEGSNHVNVTAAGTNGQVLIASSTGDPQFSTITSSGGTVTFNFGPNSLNIEVSSSSAFTFPIPLSIEDGGTGRTLLTTFGVLLGEGSNGVNVTAAGTNGQVLVASTTGDPKFATISSTGNTLTFTFGVNSLNIDINLSGNSFFNPLQVGNGGTGRTILTAFGVLLGEGSNNINVTDAGTDGQVFIGSSTGDPQFNTITSSLGTLAFVASHGSLNIDLNIPVRVGFGGTGRTLLTTFGVLVGEGSNGVNVTAAGTNGQTLLASTTGDPKFATITSTGNTLTFTFGVNSLNIDVNLSDNSFFNPLQVGFGGTGRTILTAFGVILGEGSNQVNVTAAGTDGQLLIGSSTGDPKFNTLISSLGTLTFVFGHSSINIDLNIPVTVGFGGTGRTVLTTFGVLVGEGSNGVNVIAPGTNGQVLMASTTGDPKFTGITSTGNTLTFTFGVNSLNIDINFSGNSFFNPLQVGNGGTGRTILTAFGVLLGEGSNSINVTAAGTDGQVFIGSSTGDPQFNTITSSLGTLAFLASHGSLNIDLNIPVTVGFGGTGRTLLTTFGVLVGEGSNGVNVTAAGTNGQILLASTTGDPIFTTITSTGGTVTFTFGPNSLNVDLNIPGFTFINPWPVNNGGTGRTILTAFGVILGEGSNQVNVTAAGTDGQLLIGSSTGDPKFNTLTSSQGTLTFVFGRSSINIDLNIPVTVGFGGTGRTLLTTFGVLVGEGSNGVNVTSAGTNGQILMASTTGDPKFATITSTGNTLTFIFGFNSLNIDVNLVGNSFFNPLQVGNGGTGRTILTAFGVLLGEGSNNINVTAAGTNGQVLIGSSTGDPQFNTITSSSGTLAFVPSAGSLNIDLNIPVRVGFGGTGRTLLTTFGVLIGEGSNGVNVTAAGTNGQTLIASTTGDPRFATISSTGGTVTFTFGPNGLNIDVNLYGNTFFNPLQVRNGGTGRTILTAFGVILGEGSNQVNVTAAGTNGQLLIGSSTGDPKFNTLTSSLGTLAFVASSGSLNIDLNIPVTVRSGGTGRTLLTTFGVLIGEGSNRVNVTAAGTNGQTLIASTTGDPRFVTISSTGGTVTFTFGPNGLNIDVNLYGNTFFNPLQVGNGGTGRTILTAFGVLLGEGSNRINVTAAGTDGQVFIASSTGDPQFNTITSSLGTLAFVASRSSLNIDLNIPVRVGFGGTGRTLLTTFGVLIGEGSNGVNVTAAGTNGQILIASTTGDPKFATITSTGNTLTFTFGVNSLNIDVNLSGSSFFNPLQVGFGGTGRTILTTFGVILGEGSNQVNVTAAGTDGQLLIGSSTGDPKFSTLTSSLGTLTFVFGPSSVNIDLNIPVTVVFGGTGRTLLTTFGVLLGEGSNGVNVTAAGTNGQTLIASTTGDPKFATISSTGGTVTFTFGPNGLNIDVNLYGNTFFNPLQVGNGGTGRTILTAFGVLLGEGSNSINVTAAGTDGQVFIASSTGDPQFNTITSSLGTLTFVASRGSLNIDLNIPVTVGFGGTGRTLLTTFGVLVGEGSNGVNVTAAGTNGQTLIASTTGDPKFATITSTGNTLTFTFGVNSLNIDVNLSGSSFFNPLQVGFGGTGRTILTTFGVILGEGSNQVNVTAAGTDGQLLIGSSTGDPKFSTLTSSLGTLTFVFGRSSVNIDLNIPILVGSGGTGRTLLTTFGVLLGEGSNGVNVTAAGTNGQTLIASTTGDPKFSTITSTGNTLTFTFGVNSLNIDVNLYGNSFFNPLQVGFGGTGRTILTAFGVILGEGSNQVNVTAAGTDGQLFIGSSTGDPKFSTLTSSLGTLTFVFGRSSVNIDLNIPVTVTSGGTGRTLLTTFGVLLGEGSNGVNVTAAGTNGQVLIASTTGDPKFSTITSTGNTLTFTFGVNSLNIDVNLYGNSFFNPLQVGNGGTGRTILTAFGVILGEGSNRVNVTAAGTDGQLLIGSSTGDPKFSTLTSSLGSLTFVFGRSSVNIDLNIPILVRSGGTGRTLLTTFGVLIGEGSNSVNVTAAGTNGQILIASTASDPKFATVSSTGNTLTFTFGANSLNIDINLLGSSFFNPLQVGNGGTGRTILTSFGVLLGEGSNQVNVTVPGTDGQVFIGSSTGDPQFNTITSSLGTLVFVASPGSLNIDLNIPVTVGFGGTGRTLLTTFGVLLGEGSNGVNVTAAGTNGQALIASTTGDPAFATITSTGNTLTFTWGVNSLNIDVNLYGNSFFNPVQVGFGGTGRTILTAFGVILGEGSNQVNVTAAGTDGQLLIGSSTGDPKFNTLTSSLGTLTFVFGRSSVNIDLNIPILVGSGGTGRTLLTTFGVLLGEGSNGVNVTAAGTNGQTLIASTTGDPKFVTISSTGNTLTFTFGVNSLNIDVINLIANTFFNPLQVGNGGTGRTILTRFGVILGEGSNQVNVTAAGTDGQLLIGSSTGDPKFSTLTSSLGTLTFVFGRSSVNIDLNTPVRVGFGGTGRTLLTTFGVLIGEGSNSVNVTAAGTNGQVLIASTTGDPKFSTITSTGNTLTFTFGVNSLNIEVNLSGNTFFNPLQVGNGGTGRTILTAFGVLLGEGSNRINVTAAGTDGQVFIGSSTGDPQFNTITSSLGTLVFVASRGSLNLDLNIPVPVRFGGTGRTLLTTFGVMLGEGSNGINVTAAGTNGQTLIASTTGDPKFATLSSSGGTLTFTFGVNSLNIDVINLTTNTFFNPLQVGNGGTGRTLLTAFGVILGEGSNQVNVTAAGTDGQLFIGSSTGDPQFNTITSSLGTLTFVFGHSSVNIDLNIPILVGSGGTGLTLLTTFGVLIGEGSNNVNVTAAGTNGQLLIASTTGDPAFSTITSSGGTLTFSFGPNGLNIDLDLYGNTFFNPLQVGNGGTGLTVLTAFGVLLGEGSNNINVTAAGTDGQVFMGSSTGDPQFNTITSSLATLVFVASPGSLNIDLNVPVAVGFGGTGITILTTFGVLIGEGSNDINVTAAGTNGQLLISATGADPSFSTITSAANTLTFKFGPNSLDIGINLSGNSFFNPLQVGNGGTGQTILTAHGVLLGEGANPIGVTAAGTDGQLLIGSSLGDPIFNTITSSLGTLSFVVGHGSLNIDLKIPVVVGFGGTGRTLLTTFGVMIGEGSNRVNVTAPGTNGQVLMASTTGDPKFSTITSTGNTLTFTFGVNSLNIDINLFGNSFFNPLQVGNGGTGRTILTSFGVLLGEGSNQVNVTAAGTDGQVLIGSSTGDPRFNTITSSLGTLAFVASRGSLNIDLNIPVAVGFGGTGRTLLTTFGVLIGEGSNGVNVTAAGTNGQTLIASTTGDPKFATISSTGNTLSFTFGANSLNIDVNLYGNSFFNPLQVGFGGTGQTILTAFGVLLGEGSNRINVTAAGTNGQLFIGSSTGDPSFNTLTSSLGTLAFVVSPGSLNIDVNIPVLVVSGGTGRTLLTTFGVVLGEGSNAVNVTAPGTNGQTLIASTTGDPKFVTITSTGGTVTFTFGPNSLNMDVNLYGNTFFNPLQVGNGGTGLTLLTAFGVLLGAGSNNIQVTSAGTDGQVFIGSSTGNPQFNTLTSSLGTLVFSVGRGSLNIDMLVPVPVNFGGTGRTILTTFGVLVGEGSNSINVTPAGTNSQLLIASTTGDPRFATLTSAAATITFTFGPNSLNLDANLYGNTFFNPMQVGNGGTGRTILTRFGVLVGEGSNSVNATSAGTNGQLLIASTTGDPKFSTITSSNQSLTFNLGPNSLDIQVINSSGLAYQTDSGLASPAAGVITIGGSSQISTTGTGSTITIQISSVSLGSGGTSRTILTTYGVLLGEGSNAVNVTAAGTNGQVLLASTTGDPKFATITSTGNTVTFTFGPNSLNIEAFPNIPVPLPLASGGTGRTIFTRFGVLIGEGSNQLNATTAGTNGQVLIASTTGDPKFSTITSTGGTLTFVAGVNSLNAEVNFNHSFFNPLQVGNGGTGRTILTTFGVLIGEGSNSMNVTAAGTNGQVLIASTTGDPRFATITSTGGTIAFVGGVNSLNLEINLASTFFNPLQVSNGGTGETVLTLFGVLIGEGSNNVNVTAAGTNGQILIASTTGDPAFATITSTGGTLTFIAGINSLNIEINLGSTFFNPLQVGNGGTGQTVLTLFGVLIGEGSNNVNVTAAGTNGQILIASTTGDPAFSTITSTGGTLTFIAGVNSLNIEVNFGSTFFNPLQVGNGGTGRTVLTLFGVLIGEGSNRVNVTAAGTNGQVLLASTTGDPAFASITSTGGTVTFTFGPNSLNMEINLSINPFFNPMQVGNGGTGQTILTTFGVLLGEGSNNVNVTAAGTNGQVLLGSSTGDPQFNTLTSSLGTLAFTASGGGLNIDINGALNVAFGGTGQTILTSFGVLLGEGSNSVNVTDPGTNGQVLIASSTGDPAFATFTSAGGTISFTFGPNSINIEKIGTDLSSVATGGTGRTILTTYGVLIGEGSNNINVTAAGTNGQVLIASTTGDPKFATITSTGNTITFTYGANSLNIDLALQAVTSVQLGGTGRTILTTYGVLIGEGSNNVNVTAAGTNGQVLIASTSGDPKFATISSTGGTITFTFGPNSLNIDAVTPFATVQLGGTGRTILTTFGVLIGEGSNNVNVTAAGTNGQVLIASTIGDPKFATITSTGSTLTFNFGPNSINIDLVTQTVMPVELGGTGKTILTTFGVLIGQGSNDIAVTAAGVNGQVLIAATGANPVFSRISSTGGTLTFQFGVNSLNIDLVSTILSPARGGTGRTILTSFGVLLGEGSRQINATAAGTNGQVLLGSSTGDPLFNTLTSSLGSLAFTGGPGSLNIDLNIPVRVQFGGTGRTLLTTFGVLIGEGSNSVNVTAAGTNGQVLLASSAGDPKFGTITSSGGSLVITAGANLLNLDTASSAVSVVSVSAGTTSVTSSFGYYAVDSSAGTVTLNFPVSLASNFYWTVKDSTGFSFINPIIITTVPGTLTFDGETIFNLINPYGAVNILYNSNSSRYEIF